MLDLLSQYDAYALNSRRPGDNVTFEFGGQPCSILDYAIAPAALYAGGATAQVTDDSWHVDRSGHKVLLTSVPVHVIKTPPPPKTKPYMKWRLGCFLDNERSADACEAYETALDAQWQQISQRCSVPNLTPEALVRVVTDTITTAAQAAIGQKKVVPGRTKSWWNKSISDAVDKRRNLRKLSKAQPNNAQLASCLKAQCQHVQQLVRTAKELLEVDMAIKVNTTHSATVDDHSPLGKKEMWNAISSVHGYKGKVHNEVQAAAVDPSSGSRLVGTDGVLTAQANHTRLLGSSSTFASHNQQFDETWHQHVTTRVAQYRSTCSDSLRAASPVEPPHDLDAPIVADEILEAMQSLRNGKAPSPVSTIPNELLKYGGQAMADILQVLFGAIWASGCPPHDWLYGVVQYFHKSGATDDMNNYRGITLLDVVSKLFHKVLANRMLGYAETHGLLDTAQNAFRKGRSTDDHIFCISQVVRGRQRMKQATYVFFLDLRKAYDTVWRDGLLYKLWQLGIRGRMWHYINALYTTSRRVVRSDGQLSSEVVIDLGVAQGDTMSCILFNLFVNDMVAAYQAACPGVTLPSSSAAADTGAASDTPQATLSSQLFADDFMGVAASRAELQCGIDAAHAWCCKWRMQANIGPAKTAFIIFAAEHAPVSEAGGVLWGGHPLPVVTQYKYLGVMLSSSCSWDAHVAYLCEKARKTAYALGSVLHNRRISVGARRLVLLAVLRPVVEYASTVWEATPQQLRRLEEVQLRVLCRIVRLNCHVAHDILRMELGCRSYSSWMDQRKLEYAYRLATMHPARLPSVVSAATWPPPRSRSAPMHAELAAALQASVGVSVLANRTSGVSYGIFKGLVGLAVRRRDMVVARSGGRSTVGCYDRIVGCPGLHPIQLQPYLTGPMTALHRAKFLCRSGMLLTAHRQHRLKKAPSPACPHCRTCLDETLAHAVLACPRYDAMRDEMWEALVDRAGAGVVDRVQALPLQERLEAVLGDHAWGAVAGGVGEIVERYLGKLLVARDVTLAPAGAAAGGRQGAEVACQQCHLPRRDMRDVLLLCDDCGCGCHQRCLQIVLHAAPQRRWRCPACVQLRRGAAGACGQLMRRSAEPGYVIHTAGLFPGTAPEDYDGSRDGTDVACRRCGDKEAAGMLLCDACDHGFHMECLGMRRRRKPSGLWFCPDCQPDAVTLAQLHKPSARRGARAHGACATAGA
jgi:hypothetical protein